MPSSFLITLFLGIQLLEIPENIMPAWLTLFKEYPILNHGTSESVRSNLQYFSKEPHCAVLIAETDDHIMAGLATGIPLVAYPYETELFQKSNLDPSDFYHINDLIVSPRYRKQGIASKLYKKLEKQVTSWGYTKICLCTIEHEDNHPLKPINFYDSTIFWQHQEFSKTSLKIKESWPTIIDEQGMVEMYEHTLVFWIKELK